MAGQALLFALHALEPSNGETMVRRFFLWQVMNLFERPGDRQFGIPFVVMVIGVLLAPKRAWLWIVSSLSVAAMIVAFSIARASNSAPLSTELVMSVLARRLSLSARHVLAHRAHDAAHAGAGDGGHRRERVAARLGARRSGGPPSAPRTCSGSDGWCGSA